MNQDRQGYPLNTVDLQLFCLFGNKAAYCAPELKLSRRLQYPLIEAYTLNYIVESLIGLTLNSLIKLYWSLWVKLSNLDSRLALPIWFFQQYSMKPLILVSHHVYPTGARCLPALSAWSAENPRPIRLQAPL